MDNIHASLQTSSTSRGGLTAMLAAELINPLYSVDTRRSQSVVKEEYIPMLDSWFDPSYSRATYPMNSRGSLARINSKSVELFVNIPHLDAIVREQGRNSSLAETLGTLEHGGGLSVIRDVYRDVLNIVGKKDYDVEWSHVSTRARYGELELTNIGYSECNAHLAELLGISLLQRQKDGIQGETVIVEAGVGTGGTTVPVIKKLLELEKSGLLSDKLINGIRLLLFDTDERKTSFLKTRIPADLGFPAERILSANGDFENLADVLEQYRGRISYLVSGASICHVDDKKDFFRQVYSLLGERGDLYLWDPLEPLLFAPRMRVTDNRSAHYKRRITVIKKDGSGQEYVLDRFEPLPEEILRYQKNGCRIKALGEIPAEDAIRFCGTTAFEYLPQLGFTADTIGNELAARLCRDAYEFLMEGIFSMEGIGFFDYIEWMQKRCSGLPADEGSRSPYQLIEAVEDVESYAIYLNEAGFCDIKSCYLSPAVDYRKTGDAAAASSAAIGYVEARKAEDRHA